MSGTSERPNAAAPAVRGWPSKRALEPAQEKAEPESLTSWVRVRLSKAIGPARAEVVIAETLQHINRSTLENPKDLLDFAEHLVRQGGLVMTVGCTFKIHAVLRGATQKT